MSEDKTLDEWGFYPGGSIKGKLSCGKWIRTSAVVARNLKPLSVMTESGSIYKLLKHGGKGYPPDMIWDGEGWCAGGIKKRIPTIEEYVDAKDTSRKEAGKDK